jgi:hypothetical protein
MAETTITDSDEGKKVVNQSGDEIGRITEVENGRAYVDPDPSVTDSVMSKLGWGSRDKDTYLLEEDNIETIADDEVRLGSL